MRIHAPASVSGAQFSNTTTFAKFAICEILFVYLAIHLQIESSNIPVLCSFLPSGVIFYRIHPSEFNDLELCDLIGI